MVPVERARTWVGVAGTMTTLSALAQKMTTYDPAAIHLSRVGFGDLLRVCDELIAMTRQQRAALGPMHEGRVDVIGGGAIIVEELADALGQPGGHRRAGGQRARHPRRHRAVDRLASGRASRVRFGRFVGSVALAREGEAEQHHADAEPEMQPVVGAVDGQELALLPWSMNSPCSHSAR